MQKQQNVLILLDHMLPMQCLVKSLNIPQQDETESEVTDEPAEEEPSAEFETETETETDTEEESE